MKRTRRNAPAKPAILPGEALEILASAVGYCQQAGLTVQTGDVDGKLVIVISDARIASGEVGVRFAAGNPPSKSPRAKTTAGSSGEAPIPA